MKPLFLSEGSVALRPLAEEDAPLLLRWLTDSRVLEYWEGPNAKFTPQRIREQFYSKEKDFFRCIVEYEERSIGYLQAYRLDQELFKEYEYSPEPGALSFGIDQFIGEPEYWGQKIGRAFVSLVVTYLTQQEGAASVVLDPHTDNLRAIRCYEACGFRKLKFLPAHELHDGVLVDCWLMEYRAKRAVAL